jgi:hypothetical protein
VPRPPRAHHRAPGPGPQLVTRSKRERFATSRTGGSAGPSTRSTSATGSAGSASSATGLAGGNTRYRSIASASLRVPRSRTGVGFARRLRCGQSGHAHSVPVVQSTHTTNEVSEREFARFENHQLGTLTGDSDIARFLSDAPARPVRLRDESTCSYVNYAASRAALRARSASARSAR